MRLPARGLPIVGQFVVAAAVVAAAFSYALDAQEVRTRSGPRVIEVPIQGYRFPENLTVEVGDSVVWVNKDSMPHSAARYRQEGTVVDQPFNTGFIQPGQKSDPITFLKETGLKDLTYGCDVHEHTMREGRIVVKARTDGTPHASAPPSPTSVHPPAEAPILKQRMKTEHSMVASGSSGSAIFMHHYSLFNNPDHPFHVTVEARLNDEHARQAYEAYRAQFPMEQVMMDVTEWFLLTDIRDGRRSFPSRFSHTGTRTEIPSKRCPPTGFQSPEIQTQWGWVIPCLNEVGLTITRIIQFRHYHPDARYPESLVYQLYGKGNEVYLAHEVTEAPSFLHVVQLAEIPAFLTPEWIHKSPLVSIPAKRLQKGKQRSVEAAVLNDNTHFLMAPPTGTLNPKPPIQNGEIITVLIEGDPSPSQPKQLKVGTTIFFDPRILNR
jgi:plastocyanin